MLPPGALGVIRQFRPIVWAENNAYFDSGGKAPSSHVMRFPLSDVDSVA